MNYVSSSAFGVTDLVRLVNMSNELNLPVEFSYMDYYEDSAEVLRKLNVPFLMHNYFPRPREDFTLNLASGDSEIRNKAIRHCLQSMKMCAHFGLGFFSVHSGFRMDIAPLALGGRLPNVELLSYKDAYELFLQSIDTILALTSDLAVRLLVENNVITGDNLLRTGENPLLMCDHDELIRLLADIRDERLGLLVDLGHLNCSAHSLGFSRETFVDCLSSSIECLHLNDNNGIVDEHEAFDKKAWFLPLLTDFKETPKVIETRTVSLDHICYMFEVIS